MSLIGNLFTSSIGRKFIMAVSGVILVGFAAGHLVGNLQIFGSPDKINGYAHFLQTLGPALWLVRLVLLAAVAVHIWAAMALALENSKARGPAGYGVNKVIRATLASRTMRMTGSVIFAFIVYHIAHFTLGVASHDTFKSSLPLWTMQEDAREFGVPLAAKGMEVHDVYSMVFLGFSNPVVSIFYMIATSLLAFHLLHGIDSLFQTIGWRNHRWCCWLRKAAAAFCLLYAFGSLAIPGAILTVLHKPAAGTQAAKVCATSHCCDIKR